MAKAATKTAPRGSVNRSAPSSPSKNLPATRSTKSTEVANMDLEGLSGMGTENVTAKDIIIPRLTLLQGLSPQLNKKKPEYIKEAQAGMFCDTATGDVWSDELEYLPCFFATIYLEWAPRDTGKGLIANHGTNPAILEKCRVDEKQKKWLGNNLIAETMTFFGFNLSAGGRRSFLPMSSTQLKNGRKWITKITAERVPGRNGEFQPPMFYRSWIARPTEESNAQGDWFGWAFEPGQTILELDPSKKLLAEAKDFYEQCAKGLVMGDLASFNNEGDAGESHGDDKAM